jgi:steroid Delta-isomerase
MDRVDAHVALFNAAVRSNDWPAFVATFAPDAIMGFVGVPAGPFRGRDAIAQAYANQPPDDTMTVHTVTSSGARDRVRFGWDGGGDGTMDLLWRGDQVAELFVTFDLTRPEAAP